MKEKNSKHEFENFSIALKNNDIENSLVICGDEDYLTDWAVKSITNKYIDKSSEVIDKVYLYNEMITSEKIKEACETYPLISEKKIVIADINDDFYNTKLKIKEKEEIQKIVDYLNKVPEKTILILKGNVFRNYENKIKKCKNCRIYNFYKLNENDLKKFIVSRMKNENKIISKNLILKIIRSTGYFNKESNYTLYDMENDLKKIIAYSNEDEIKIADVEMIISGSLENNVFALIDSISNGRKDQALMLYNNLIYLGNNLYSILSLIISQFEIMLKIKEMKSDGYSLDKIEKTLKIHSYRLKMINKSCSMYSEKIIKKILINAYNIDKNIKSGMLEQNIAMEIFIASI